MGDERIYVMLCISFSRHCTPRWQLVVTTMSDTYGSSQQMYKWVMIVIVNGDGQICALGMRS